MCSPSVTVSAFACGWVGQGERHEYVVSGSRDKTVRVWDAITGNTPPPRANTLRRQSVALRSSAGIARGAASIAEPTLSLLLACPMTHSSMASFLQASCS